MMVPVFDIGNVLLRWNPRALFDKILPDSTAVDTFLQTALTPDFLAETDRAKTLSPLIKSQNSLYPQHAAALNAFDARWMETIIGPIEDNVALLMRLRAKNIPVYAISNFCAEKFADTRKIYPFLDLFTGAIISGREGLIKPERAIFDLFFSRFGLEPSKTIFIDDSAMNIAAARSCGMNAIHYTDGVHVESALAEWGVKI